MLEAERFDPYKDHLVEVVVETEAVQVYVLREAPKRNANAVQIAFTPWGIGITGDLCPGKDNRGVWSRNAYGRGWFLKAGGESYLAEKFLEESWDAKRAWDDLEAQLKEADGARERKRLREVLDSPWEHEHELYEAMSEAGLETGDGVPGYDYRENDVAMLVSLQARLRRHFGDGGT